MTDLTGQQEEFNIEGVGTCFAHKVKFPWFKKYTFFGTTRTINGGEIYSSSVFQVNGSERQL